MENLTTLDSFLMWNDGWKVHRVHGFKKAMQFLFKLQIFDSGWRESTQTLSIACWGQGPLQQQGTSVMLHHDNKEQSDNKEQLDNLIM